MNIHKVKESQISVLPYDS